MHLMKKETLDGKNSSKNTNVIEWEIIGLKYIIQKNSASKQTLSREVCLPLLFHLLNFLFYK